MIKLNDVNWTDLLAKGNEALSKLGFQPFEFEDEARPSEGPVARFLMQRLPDGSLTLPSSLESFISPNRNIGVLSYTTTIVCEREAFRFRFFWTNYGVTGRGDGIKLQSPRLFEITYVRSQNEVYRSIVIFPGEGLDLNNVSDLEISFDFIKETIDRLLVEIEGKIS